MLVPFSRLKNSNSVFTLDFKRQKAKKKKYINETGVSFDIETTTIKKTYKKEIHPYSYMYIATFAIGTINIYCTSWNEVVDFLNQIIKSNKLNKDKKVIIWVANLSFEFQFMRKHLNITNIVARSKRNILMFEVDKCIIFQDALAISGGNLAYLASKYTKTQKLVGDLDYSILRTYKDIEKLSPKEKQYIINDVQILVEFHKYILDNFEKIPLTKTSIVRNVLKENFKKSHDYFKQQEYKEAITRMFPKNLDIYQSIMCYLFRGGYVHANYKYANKIIKDILFFDEKSAYPYTMLFKYIPNTPFNEIKISKKELAEYLNRYCCILDISFSGIKAKTTHSIESINKAIEYDKAFLDNGRIQQAKHLRVLLTELDFDIYTKYYTWENFKINSIQIAGRGELPKFIKDTIISFFEIKENTTKDTAEYTQNKANLNSIYGCMVTRLLEYDYKVIDGEVFEVPAKDYSEQIKNKILSPFWGIWCTSHARYLLLNASCQLEEVAYNDTDSIECKDTPYNRKFIDKYNTALQKANLDRYHNKLLEKLGTFELEKKAEKFKTLGAKRYIYTSSGNDYTTIAGLPKTALSDFCIENNIDIYDMFSPEMILDIDVSMKHTATYNDTAHSDTINGVEMFEESSVSIIDIPFKLSVSEYYLYLIENYVEENKKLEGRLN